MIKKLQYYASVTLIGSNLLFTGCTANQQDSLFDSVIGLARDSAGLEVKTASANDVTLTYMERMGKQKNAESIVLVHGFSANKDNWIRFTSAIDEKYHVIAVDLAGHGDSEKRLTTDYGLVKQAERLDALLTNLDIKEFHIAGNSMGGAISAIYSVNYPDRVKSLNLIDAAGIDGETPSEYYQALAEGKNPLIATDADSFDYRMDFTMSEEGITLNLATRQILDDGFGNAETLNGFGIVDQIRGSDGDDSINLAGINAEGNGGQGDDLISASFANGGILNGDAGDDTLNGWRNSTGLVIDGGLGNDTITDEAHLELPGADDVPDILTGGEGADSFFINFVNPEIFEGQEQVLEGDIGIVSQITDFDPDEDMLMIDINNADDAGTTDPVRTLDSFTLVEAADGSYTDVQLVISTAGGTGTLTATIRLDGATGLTNDDIAFADRAVV